MSNKKFKINCDYPKMNIKKGAILDLDVYPNGTPKDKFWRRRFADSIIDNCMELVGTEEKQKESPKETKNQDKKAEGVKK